ncbi:MAG: ATP-binding protein [Oscillospiraceae bacterium]|jgi:AAA+ ATPase superfamily predicted ATPase|nr:ATP-binding protein [Oscillospiraceae bacterium]
MFISRTDELDALNRLYSSGKFQMAVVYGRRRVGKTTLISEFVKDKPAIFFAAQEANKHLNLRLFSEDVYKFFGLPKGAGAFRDWHDAFSFIAERAGESRFILVLDEFPYLAAADRSIKSVIQNAIDYGLKDTGIFLILCGSQISFMEKQVLGYKSPLFGRRTAQFRIDSFDYYDAAKMLGDASNEDKIKYYACVGGTPHYLAQINHSLTFGENISELYFKPYGYLFGEPVMLLQQELREPAMYNSVISAVATGASRLNDIATKINEDTSKTGKYVKTLTDMRILRKSAPFGENQERSRKTLYGIYDNCYRFWYKYVFLNRAAVETGSGGIVAESMVFPELSTYIGKPVFEDVCRQYIIRKNRERALPFLATNFGSWWGADKRERTPSDIDAVADNRTLGDILMCECKWRNEATDAGELRRLLDKARFLPGYERYHFMFFSKSPYTRAARKLEEENDNLRLITLDMLFD